MKIALGQMRVQPGRIQTNLETISNLARQARDAGAAVLALPEMCVGGYLLGDRWLDESFCRDLAAANQEIAALSDGLLLMWGNLHIDQNAPNKDGRVRKFNAAHAWFNRAPVRHCGTEHPLWPGITIKTLLPNYRVFDDERYFFSLQELSLDLGLPLQTLLQPFQTEIAGQPFCFGLEICEDLWFNDYRYQGAPLNVSRMLMQNGAQAIFNLSASPWTWGKDRARANRIRDIQRDAGGLAPFFYVNCVGVQNNGKNFVTFDGDSTVYAPDGGVHAAIEKPYHQDILLAEWPLPASGIVEPLVEAGPDARTSAQFRAAIEGLRAMDELIGCSDYPFVIGLSGGVDSAVVLCLLEQAFGAGRIIACNLPSRYNSTETKSIADRLVAALGITLHRISIEEMAELNGTLLEPFKPQQLHLENIQAKIRGTNILSNIAGIRGGVMTNNGNKVEIALGYATLYGDVNGAIAPIGDLLKTEVFAMAAYLNSVVYQNEVIPNELLPDKRMRFGVAPSAELKEKQVDPMKWGYHDELVRVFTDYRRASPQDILSWYLDGILCERLGISPDLLELYGLGDPAVFLADLEWFVAAFQRAVFKRVQAPPIIIMSKGSFGFDVRESQLPVVHSPGYLRLREKVLSLSNGR